MKRFAETAIVLTGLLCGCSAPTATLDLITVARSGLASAREAQTQQHAQLAAQVQSRQTAMDSAFDADVRLVAAGAVLDESGRPVALDAQWVIDARKGYAVARDDLARQFRELEAANAVRLDNIQAADEALQMASELIAAQWDVSQRVREQLLAAQRALLRK